MFCILLFFSEQSELINCLVNGNRGKQYSKNIRKFCLRLNYHSSAAYQSLREFFNKNLPAKRTMQLWYSTIEASPGKVCKDALDILREKAVAYQEENSHQLHLTLISDEMSIRKEICWDNEMKKFVGFSETTNSSQQQDHDEVPDQNSQKLKVAKDALVLLVVGPDFKLPVAYYLLNGLESFDRAAATLDVIRQVEDVGARFVSLTADGLFANLTVAETLGAKFDENRTYFLSPTYSEHKIYIIFDAPHMLKLVRKHFCLDKIYHNEQLVDWNLVRVLSEKQSSDNFNLCNKLSKLHIDWHQKPMNVRLAAETISQSVANALEQLHRDGYPDFENATATVEFIKTFDNVFNVMNFAEKNRRDGFKQPICDETAEQIFSFGEKFKEYVNELEIRMKTKRLPILKSRSKMGFFGFYHNFTSLKGIYEDFVQNGPLKEFYTFQFSQDHLETFFSLVRNCQGRNDNPNAVELRSAFRKLLICYPLMTSVGHNVISNETRILTVPATNKKRLVPRTPIGQQAVELYVVYDEVMFQEITEMDPYDQHMCAYVALSIERRIMQNIKMNRYKCEACANILLSTNQKINDELLAMNITESEEIQQPTESTLKIVIFSNAVMKMLSSKRNQESIFDVVWSTTVSNLDFEDLYANIEFEHHAQDLSNVLSHKEQFIIQVVKTYLALKSQKIGKKITDEERGELIRSRRKHAIHLAGQ